MKTTFRKITVLVSSVMLAAVGLVTMPATSASAAGSLKPWNGYVNLWGGGNNLSNTTGDFSLPGGNLGANFSYSARVPFGTVQAGDVLTLKLKLVKVSDNTPYEVRQNGCSTSTKLWLETQPNCDQGFRTGGTELVYTQTLTAAEASSGIFTNFNTSSYTDPNNSQYIYNRQYFGFYMITPDETAAVKMVATWTKNNVVVTPTANSVNYWMNINAGFEDVGEGFTVSQELSSALVPTGNQYYGGTGINTGGCINTTGLATGTVIEVDYSLTLNGGAPQKVDNYSGSTNLNWYVNNNMGGQGTEGVDWGYVSSGVNQPSTGKYTLPGLTQKMIDGYMTGPNLASKSNLMGFNVGFYGIKLVPGEYKLTLGAHVQGQSTNLLFNCDSTDVVNLSSTKQANGDIVIKFAEAGTSKYDQASMHYCQLRPNTKTSQNERWAFIGGAMAVEVSPATSPRTFTCTLKGLEPGKSFNLAMANLLGNGWAIDFQYTWLSVKSSPNVSTDATIESIGIGSATTDVYFDPAVTTYNLTSEDTTTDYPTVVTSNSTSTFVVKLGGTTVTKPNKLNLVTGKNVVTVEVTSPSGAKKTYTFNITKVNTSTDATLKSLSFGSKTLTPAFSATTTSYSAAVGSSVSSYPFPSAEANQDGATVVVKQGGSVVTGPGDLTLAEGANVVTVEVTAKDGTTKKTYTMTITRAAAAKDASLTGLPSVSGTTVSPAFSSDVTSYTSSVSESTTSVELDDDVAKTVSGATVVYKLNGVVVTAPGTLNLRPGDNKLETIVTSSDGTVTKTYTQTITRAVLAAGSSTDANDARMAVNPVPGASYVAKDGTTVEGFDSELSYEPNVYTKNVPANQTTVRIDAGGAANSGATIVNEYSTDGGATWTTVVAPGTAPLTNGKTTKIRTTVTNGTSTKVYVTDVISPAVDPNADVAPADGDGDIPAKGIAGTGKFIASNDSTFQLAWTKSTGKLVSQATGIYTGYIEAKITFTKAGKSYTCTTQFGTIKAMPAATAAQKAAAMKMKTFAGKQFCTDKTKMNPATTAPVGGLTKANFLKIKPMNKTTAELNQEKAALTALKGFTGEVQIQVVRYRAWPSTMVNLGNWDSKGGKISVQIRNTKVALN